MHPLHTKGKLVTSLFCVTVTHFLPRSHRNRSFLFGHKTGLVPNRFCVFSAFAYSICASHNRLSWVVGPAHPTYTIWNRRNFLPNWSAQSTISDELHTYFTQIADKCQFPPTGVQLPYKSTSVIITNVVRDPPTEVGERFTFCNWDLVEFEKLRYVVLQELLVTTKSCSNFTETVTKREFNPNFVICWGRREIWINRRKQLFSAFSHDSFPQKSRITSLAWTLKRLSRKQCLV